MSTAVIETSPMQHLQHILEATTEVLNSLQLLESCRFGPSSVIDAAVADLTASMEALERLGPSGGHPSLGQLDAATDDAGHALCALIRNNVAKIREESLGVSLELRRLVADNRDVISIATGSAGTYDALGRTTSGQVRRTRGAM
jgi:hypothetical protein